MRKIGMIALVLCFLLQPMVGNAQTYCTIGELRESIPERWTQTYDTKWRDISVNVQPIVPDVAKLPVLEMAMMAFQPDAKAEEATGWTIGTRGSGYWLDVTKGEIDEERDRAVKNKEWKRITDRYYDSYSLDRAYARNNVLTLGEALDFLGVILEKVGVAPEHFLLARPQSVVIDNDTEKATGDMLIPGTYSIVLYPQLRNVPILCHALLGVNQPRDEERWIFPETLFSIRNYNSFSVVVKPSPLKEVALLTDDTPLCAFSKVVEEIENEIQAGHIRKIYDLELGYVLYNPPGFVKKTGAEYYETDTYYAVPAWRVNCLYESNAKKELRDYEGQDVPERATIEYSTLIINPQNGKMHEYMDNRMGCGDYQGFISWEDVGGKH